MAALFSLRVNEGASVAIAGPAAVAYGVTYLAHRIVATSRGSSQIRLNQIVGAAEIPRAVAEPLPRIDRITMVNTGNGQDPGMSRITIDADPPARASKGKDPAT